MHASTLISRTLTLTLLALLTTESPNIQAADPSNFGTITLGQTSRNTGNIAPEKAPEIDPQTGRTGGSYSLTALANRDRDNNTCLGYGDSRPDYILILTKDLDRLQLQVDSGGADTTLVIEGPDGFRCADDGPKPKAGAAKGPTSPDAYLNGSNWKAGTYRVWVGTVTPADRRSYRLIITQPPKAEPRKSESSKP
jgi:hypothetical protein